MTAVFVLANERKNFWSNPEDIAVNEIKEILAQLKGKNFNNGIT